VADSSYADYYSSLASYFSNSGGTGSPGKAGGAGYSNDLSSGETVGGDKQQASAQSGSGWISAAASSDTTDKSNFSTPFTQGFGGITNNQIIQSPGATNNASTQPITAPPIPGLSAPGGLLGTGLTVEALVVYLAIAFVAVKFAK
jgi:hypothetical protein